MKGGAGACRSHSELSMFHVTIEGETGETPHTKWCRISGINSICTYIYILTYINYDVYSIGYFALLLLFPMFN